MLTDFSHSYPYPISFVTKEFTLFNTFIENQKDITRICVLMDENTKNMCYPILLKNCAILKDAILIEIASGENFKTLETCKYIWDIFSFNKCDRNTLLINLGGGVICDLGGFTAATFKRGFSFINIPTTLLSMVDASAGGKLGLDYYNLKNQIGLFKNPTAIFVDLNFLRSLPKNELLSGFAEVIKHALIADYEYWLFLQKTPIGLMKWKYLVMTSIKIKSNIVADDPLDNNQRKTLNFGHTVGHALESYSLYLNNKTALLHGEAVAMGMIVESYLSYKKAGLSHLELDQITSFISSLYTLIKIPSESFNHIVDLMFNDKKNINGIIHCTLLNNIGSSSIDMPCSPKEIKTAFEYYLSVI